MRFPKGERPQSGFTMIIHVQMDCPQSGLQQRYEDRRFKDEVQMSSLIPGILLPVSNTTLSCTLVRHGYDHVHNRFRQL